MAQEKQQSDKPQKRKPDAHGMQPGEGPRDSEHLDGAREGEALDRALDKQNEQAKEDQRRQGR